MSIEIVPEYGGNVYVEADQADECVVLRVTSSNGSWGFVGLLPDEAAALEEALAAARTTLGR